MSPKGMPVNAKLAKGPSVVSRVAAISGAEKVRSHGEGRQGLGRPPAQVPWHG